MAKIYNFNRLVKKYSNDITVKTVGSGTYIAGRYEPGEMTTTIVRGAVIPYSTTKVYQSGGNIKTSDMQLYTLDPVKFDLDNVRIEYKNRVYKVEQDSDYTDFSDVYVYKLVYVEGLT